MKTILALMFFLLTALPGFGQSDSVTIDLATANRIEKQLRSCELLKMQYYTLQQAEMEQQIKINALNAQMAQHIKKYELADTQLKLTEKQLRRKNRWNIAYKAALPVVIIGTLLIR